MKCHSPFVRLAAMGTKVVTMGAPLNRYGFETFWLSIIFKDMSGFRVFLSWWLMIGDSMVSEQKIILVNPCWSSFEADLVLWRVCGVDVGDDGLILFLEWNQEYSLWGEWESSVRDRGASIFRRWDGECFECEGWGGMICARCWGCGCFSGCNWECG